MSYGGEVCENCGQKGFEKECKKCGYKIVKTVEGGTFKMYFCDECGCTYSTGSCPMHY